ncbi:outer membrane protein assembly factor BamB [Alginatibacterium sediminis]|uniref:Outer membrane protein assembly factor BamB n=1 Tax=Alginatibacterium sediminis TaxID=2164068 RepID=A0A420E807_9ALTE|nr:outer membrane protein assembly factor BamB [Alginatibacterium sediminis]RKF15523.1 outer membrane protein assembly factor BamB [Alginatibacterium sediminis]
MVKIRTGLLSASLLLGLSACSLFNSEEDVVVMDPVPQTTNEFEAKVVWQKQVGKGVEDYYSQLRPELAYDSVFAAARFGQVHGYGLDGTLLWKQDLSKVESNQRFSGNTNNARLSGGLTAAYQSVFVGSENADVFSLSAETGEIQWQARVDGEVLARPAVDDSNVVISTSNGFLIALDAFDGSERWKVEIDQPSLTLRSKAAPVVSNGLVVLGRSDGKLAFYLLENGRQVFESRLANPKGSTEIDRIVDLDSQPIVEGPLVYAVAYNGSLVNIDLRDGQEQWRRAYSAFRDLSISGDDLFVVDAADVLYSVAANNGIERWSQQQFGYRGLTPAAVDYQYVVVGDSEGYLYWIDRDSGVIVSQKQIDDAGLYTAPVVGSENMYVQTRSGKLIAFERQ